MRVLVPKKLQSVVLAMLHEGHMGIVKVKQVAHSYVWLPCIDRDIEDMVKACKSCQQDQKAPIRSCAITPVDMACQAMGQSTFRFHGTLYGQNFLNCC